MTGILLVTGGSRGIGAATARLAAEAGYAVAINYQHNADAAEALRTEICAIGGRAITVQADVGDEAVVERMFRTVDAALGPATALVNSAGIGGGTWRTTDFRFDILDAVLRTNVIGTMLCCREAVRRMSTRHDFPGGGQGGAIVNVSSMAGTIGGRSGKSLYGASKAAVDAYTIGLAREVATEGIRVNAIRPGVVLTDMVETLRGNPDELTRVAGSIAMNRVGAVEEAARPILFLLSEAASFISGARLDASGGGFVIAGETGR